MGPVNTNPIESRVLASYFFFQDCHEVGYAKLGKDSRLFACQGEVVSGSIKVLSAYLCLEKVEMVDRYELATSLHRVLRRNTAERPSQEPISRTRFRLYQVEERGPVVNMERTSPALG